MLRLSSPRSLVLTVAVVASVGAALQGCSKDKNDSKTDPRALKDPKAVAPGFVNTAATRQDAADQLERAASLSSKAAAAALPLNLTSMSSGAMTLSKVSPLSTLPGVSLAAVSLRLSDDDSEDKSSEGILSQIMSLSDGDDCAKLSKTFDESYEWESSFVKSSISIFSSDSKDVQFQSGDSNYVNTFDHEDMRMGLGANESLKQSVIGVTSIKSGNNIQMIMLLDEKSKTLTKTLSGSGQPDDKKVYINALDSKLESIASAKPTIKYQEKIDATYDGRSLSVEGQLTVEKTAAKQFDVSASRVTKGVESKDQTETIKGLITWGDDGKCKITNK